MKAVLLVCVLAMVATSLAMMTEEFLPVPGAGYFHKSCIHEVPSGSTVYTGDDGKPTHAICPEGKHFPIPRCEYPVLPRLIKSNPSDPTPLVSGSGWQVFTYYHAGTKLNTYTANWNVPKNPPKTSDQILYTFNGLQNEFTPMAEDGSPAPPQIDIIQPVLQFGKTPAGGGGYWGIASWYVTDAAIHSKLTKVGQNDTIFGMINETKPGKWNINGTDTTTGVSTDLSVDKGAITRLEPWAFVTLEVYQVSACNQYPTVPLTYTNIMMSASDQPETPTWKPEKQEQICKENVKVISPSAVTITF